MLYVQLYNDCGIKIDEIEIEDVEEVGVVISSNWILSPGDTIKIVEEEEGE